MASLEPNLADVDAARATFRWDVERRGLLDLGGGAINIAAEAIDRHLPTDSARLAIRFLPKEGGAVDLTLGQLAERAGRFASALRTLGVGRGERVFALSPRSPDLYAAAFGTLKRGCVFTPLFSAFGPEPVRSRVAIGEPTVLVTTQRLYERKVASWIRDEPSVKHVLLLGEVGDPPPGTIDLGRLMDESDPSHPTTPMRPDEMALLHFTSGTTGKPKGAIHVHEAVVAHHVTGKYALDLHPRDVYWCTADPGWVTGTSYGIIAPLTNRVTMIVDEAELDAERWYGILERERVTVWYTAPTAIRMLMKVSAELPERFDLSSLRFLASVGEPLNPEAVVWGERTLGLPFHDNWWQTETGGIMVANFASMPIKPGSMGKPVPGVEAEIVRRTEDGIEIVGPDETGELALRRGWPSMFRGYLHEDERYARSFVGDLYLTGDLARRDADGYFWFIGRADDVIKSAGHLIGPFEVESALLEHPAVAEAGVIGVPDEVAGEIVKAFVALKDPALANDALRKELLGHARRRLGPAVAPRALEFRDELPRTRSGKIMRRLLRARELGLEEGDLSTLEGGVR